MKRSFFIYAYLQSMRIVLLVRKVMYVLTFKIRKSMIFYQISLRMLAPFSWRHKLAKMEIDERYSDAIAVATARLKKDSENKAFLHEVIARNYRNLNQIDLAGSHIDKARELGNDHPSLLYEQGLIYFLKKQYAKAREKLEQALAQGYETAPLQIHLGKVYYQLGLMDKAERCFEKVLIVYPNEGSVYFLLGMVLKNKRMYVDARDAFLRAIEYGSDHKEEHLGLAEIYTREGQWEKAIREYQSIIRDDPANFVSHYFLGLIYEIQGYENEAIQAYIKANKLNPEDEETVNRLTRLLESSPT
ncbi:tetratricopeptide repeat protein [candidate division KSB1 bacterium]|nr:tetratricopeptide repeat protein [candidate division KSB1 bacterium]